MIKKIVLTIATVLCMCSVAFAEVPDKPTHDIYVVDNANMLDNSTKSDILNKGKELEENTGAQFVVVTINSLDGQDIESYSNDLFNSWGIGNKDNNNGVLLVVAKNDQNLHATSPCLQAWGLGMVIEFIQKLKIDNNKSQWYNELNLKRYMVGASTIGVEDVSPS